MVYKVLLVDDDSLVRVGLKSYVDWASLGLEIVGEASGGGEALGLIETHRPDIVITDMYMPDYNGLRLIQEACKSFPDTLFIVLSCHNDINYVKQSLRLGVFDYLLKSAIVDSDELVIVLSNAVKAISAKRGEQQAVGSFPIPTAPSKTDDIKVLLSYLEGDHTLLGLAAQCVKRQNIDINSDHLFLIALQMDNYDSSLSVFQDEALLDYGIRNIVNEIIGEYGGGIVFRSVKPVYFVLFNAIVKNTFISAKDKALSICERLRISLKNNIKNTCSIYLDTGKILDRLPESYRIITEEIGANRHLYYDRIVNLSECAPEACEQLTPQGVLIRATDPINDVLDYIHCNYRDQITLDELAVISNFSKYHLCKKFKEKTKTSIINYILMVRVDKAKELLLQKEQKVFKIAQAVGFNDTPYFNRVFKKVTGYTPKEFIEYNAAL